MVPQKPSSRRPASASGAERRRWARVQSDLPITVTLGDDVTPARVRDVSRAGVCFFLDRPIPMMTVLDVTLEVARHGGEKKRIRGHGAVVRCERISKAVDHWEVAVFLNDMAEADRRAMEDYVGTRAPVA
jgi:hypothetical protein